MIRSFGGFLHKSGEWVGFENGINSHDDLIRECSDFFGISRSEKNLDSMYQTVFDKGWIRVSNDYGFCVFCFNNSIPIKKAANAIHNFLTDKRYAKSSKIEIYTGEPSSNGSDFKEIFIGEFGEFGKSDLFESFSALCLLVENRVWGDAFWYNWKTGKVFPVPYDSTHGECLRMYGEEFGLLGEFKHGERHQIALSTGWAAVHNYSRILVIEVGTNISKQKMNDLVFDVLVGIENASKPVEVHIGGKIMDFGDTSLASYQ